MKRFRFALERVRRLRQHQERAARLHMAQELSVLNVLEMRHRQVEANLASCGEQGRGESMATLARALESGLGQARQRLLGQIARQEQQVQKSTEAYRERRRNLMALDRLREQRLQAWQTELLSEEQKEFDEMARVRFVQQQQERR